MVGYQAWWASIIFLSAQKMCRDVLHMASLLWYRRWAHSCMGFLIETMLITCAMLLSKGQEGGKSLIPGQEGNFCT